MVLHLRVQGLEERHEHPLRSLVVVEFTLPYLPSIYAYTLCRRTTKVDVVTQVGEGVYLGISYGSYPKRAEFQGSQILGVLL